MADTNINEINEAADNGTFLQAAFEVIVSNSKNNDTQNVTGVAVDGNGDPIQAISGNIYVIDDATLNEGYTAANLKNTNTVYMKLSANSTVEGRPGDHTGLYVHNTYDVNKITDGSLVVNFPGKTLGLVTLAGERSDYTELIVGEKYKFAISNFYEVDTYEVGDTFTVKNGVWKQTASASITAGDVYAVLTKISSFTEGGLYAGDGFVLEIKRKAVADTVGSVVVANPTLAGTEPDLTGLEVDGDKYKISPGLPDLVETTYAELKTLRDDGELAPGAFYRITDYVTIVNGKYDLSAIGAQGYLHYGTSAGHPFDIIIQAVDENTLNENARVAPHSGDTYFATQNLSAWEIKYCLDNDATKYSFADTTNGKGVIWWMKDEWGNEAGYDFKNWMFVRYALKLADATADYTPSDTGLVYNASTQPNRYGSMYNIYMALQSYMSTGTYVNPFVKNYKGLEVNDYDFAVGSNILGTIQMADLDATYLSTFAADLYYTFDYYDMTNGVHKDASFNTPNIGTDSESNSVGIYCSDNIIAVEIDMVSSVLMKRYDVIGIGGSCWENNEYILSQSTYGVFCQNNTLSRSNYCNTFGHSCDSNTFGNSCSSNTFGDSCYSNTFGDNCYSNTFGNSCSSNTFGDSCYSNTFGDNCYSNTFGDSCYSNTFGGSCYSNTFGDSCDSNTFGNSCYSNTFGTYNQDNQLQGTFSYITAGDGIQQVTFPSTMQDIQYMKEIYNYTPNTTLKATFITYTGYNQTTVVSTTDGGATWA